MPETEVPEITCPECIRIWPTISEQGIVTELYGKCYQCFINEVVFTRDARVETADYVIQNCSYCGGLPQKVSTCIMCGGKGWETVDKGKEAKAPKTPVRYPH